MFDNRMLLVDFRLPTNKARGTGASSQALHGLYTSTEVMKWKMCYHVVLYHKGTILDKGMLNV
jgi:hypothetical protein